MRFLRLFSFDILVRVTDGNQWGDRDKKRVKSQRAVSEETKWIRKPGHQNGDMHAHWRNGHISLCSDSLWSPLKRLPAAQRMTNAYWVKLYLSWPLLLPFKWFNENYLIGIIRIIRQWSQLGNNIELSRLWITKFRGKPANKEWAATVRRGPSIMTGDSLKGSFVPGSYSLGPLN